MDDPSWQSWIRQLVEGNPQVVDEFWRGYGPRLQRLAAGFMTSRICRREEPEDVVQSVCRTFLRRAQIGQFELPDSEALWRLLCAITLTKVRQKVRFHRRQRRSVDRERHFEPRADDSRPPGPEAVAPEPTPAEAAEFADQLQQLLAGMDEEERRVVELKLEQHTNLQMAKELSCSERTVRRILKRVQGRLRRMLEDA